MNTLQDRLLAYAKRKYNAEPEYHLQKYRHTTTLMHKQTRRRYAVFIDVPGWELDLDTDEIVVTLDLKMGKPKLAFQLMLQYGFLPGYHTSQADWISIPLDGAVPYEEICQWLDKSYFVTAPSAIQRECRPPKDWIVAADLEYSDILAAFGASDEIEWKQSVGMKVGDTVFFYVGAPISAILFKGKVIQTDIPCSFDSGKVRMTSLMRVRLQKCYRPYEFPLSVLEQVYGITAIRGPRGIPDSLRDDLQ